METAPLYGILKRGIQFVCRFIRPGAQASIDKELRSLLFSADLSAVFLPFFAEKDHIVFDELHHHFSHDFGMAGVY